MSMKRRKPWRNDFGKYIHIALPMATNFCRDYAAVYWPNKGIKGAELAAIHGKIVQSERDLAGDVSPPNESHESRPNGKYHTSPPR